MMKNDLWSVVPHTWGAISYDISFMSGVFFVY